MVQRGVRLCVIECPVSPSISRPLIPRMTHDARTQFVHVTGTKGKGTVCELVRCGLVAQGKRVGTFTR